MSLFDSLSRKLIDQIDMEGSPGAVLALSGGMDSMCLLHLLGAAGRPFALRAVHVDHGIRSQEEAGRDLDCLAAQCRLLGVELLVHRAPRGEIARWRVEAGGLEAGARLFRYRVLLDGLRPGEILLTAHHVDDLVETMFLAFCSGSLGKNPLKARQGRVIRPLLLCGIKQADLARLAEDRHIPFVEDATNSREEYRRNFLRRNVLPLIAEKFDSLPARVSNLGEEWEDIQAALDFYAPPDPWESCSMLGRAALCCRLDALEAMPAWFRLVHTRGAMLYCKRRGSGGEHFAKTERISRRFLLNLIETVLKNRSGRVEGPGCAIIREGNWLYMLPTLALLIKKGYLSSVCTEKVSLVYPVADVVLQLRVAGGLKSGLFLRNWDAAIPGGAGSSAISTRIRQKVPAWLRHSVVVLEDGMTVYGVIYPDLETRSWDFVAEDLTMKKSVFVEQIF